MVQAGGGWVADSDPEAEYQETVNKAKAMFKAVALDQARPPEVVPPDRPAGR